MDFSSVNSVPLERRPLVHTPTSLPPPKKTDKTRAKRRVLRADRFRLLAIARMLLIMRGKQEKHLEYPMNWHKTAKCMHVRHSNQVDVHKSKEHGNAFYTGLVVCANVFACPVCAAKVQERRRVEIAKAFDWAYKAGDKAIMVTFTFPHYRSNNLKKLLKQQSDAYKRLRAGNPWKKIRESIAYKGLIRALEVTHGDNGWHPHTHEAWFVSRDADVLELRRKIAERWFTICCRVGLAKPEQRTSFLKYSVQITDHCRTSEYLAKQDCSGHWGADRELAKGAAKQSMKNKGRHPFALLEDYAKEGSEHDAQAGALYVEFVEAMRGKNSVLWSPGLKDQVGIDVKTDEEIAQEQDDSAMLLASLSPDQWSVILKLDARSLVLDIAEEKGGIGLQQWLAEKVTPLLGYTKETIDTVTGVVTPEK